MCWCAVKDLHTHSLVCKRLAKWIRKLISLIGWWISTQTVRGFADEGVGCLCYWRVSFSDAVNMLGAANNARVYAIANYNAGSADEMSFSAGDQLTVLHKGDDKEPSWWWARHRDGTEGYVPQNLMAVSDQLFLWRTEFYRKIIILQLPWSLNVIVLVCTVLCLPVYHRHIERIYTVSQ